MAPKTLEKQTSIVEAVDASGSVFKGFNVWTDIAPAVKGEHRPDVRQMSCSSWVDQGKNAPAKHLKNNIAFRMI